MRTMIDPPGGWKFGFPKALPENHKPEDTKKWLVENGYPEKEIESYCNWFHCRYWVEEDDKNKPSGS